MNSLEDLCSIAGFALTRQALCCPHKGYRGVRCLASVSCSDTFCYVLADGSTLTVGVKLRVATFPCNSHPYDIIREAMDELREKHPKTRNCRVTASPEI